MCEHCGQQEMDAEQLEAARHEKLKRIRHSASHIMAEAVRAIFPDAKFAIGPAIADGFYYDFDLPRPLTDADLETISAKMKEIIKANVPFEHSGMTKAEAREFFKDQPYKLELIDGIQDEEVSIYKQSTFTDLCAGPHVRRTGECKHFKLTSVAGAYWRGDATKPMLQRIYGTVWPTKAELDAYLEIQEEAKKRDHRKLGKELDLFFMHPYAPGCIFWQPKGYTVYRELHNLWSEIQREQGYVEIYNPIMYDSELYKVSGHLDHYADAMFKLEVDGKTMCLKPMNCPDTMLFYKQHKHSYRELPYRVAERQVLHRNELSGALSGLTRVRQFMQDDAHLFVAPDQIEEEIGRLIKLIGSFYELFDLSYKFYLSTRPDDYMGEISLWDQAEAALANALTKNGIKYKLNPKDGAFYGPKIDILIQDSLGRQIQCATIQLDFQLPERFELEYVTPENTVARPVVIHRAIFGSYERFIGIMLEHLAGALPTWLSPVQAAFLPITDAFAPYCHEIAKQWEQAGIRTFVDDRSEKIGYKIRQATLQKIPYMLVVGQKEVESGALNLRSYKDGERGSMNPDDLKAEILDHIKNRVLDVNIKKLNLDAFINPEDIDAEEQDY
ncbi:MAG: threonine--tRNA ligase [Proteobacteria bacterium]|nr:threonine--tRNA ligase [Pseudomonadota bacterium]